MLSFFHFVSAMEHQIPVNARLELSPASVYDLREFVIKIQKNEDSHVYRLHKASGSWPHIIIQSQQDAIAIRVIAGGFTNWDHSNLGFNDKHNIINRIESYYSDAQTITL